VQIQALSKDFRDLLLLFNKHGVRYLVVGGYAVTAYGVPRYTKDIDLWIDRANDNVVKVRASLRELGFESLGLGEGDFADPETMIQLGYEPNRIDVLTWIDGVEFDEAFPKRITAEIDRWDRAGDHRQGVADQEQARHGTSSRYP